MQRTNFIVSGLMTLAAAYGVLRAIRDGRGLAIGTLSGAYGACLILDGIFSPDPVAGFPPGAAGGTVSTSGILHLLFGAIGFVCLAAAAFAYSRWASRRGERGQSVFGVASALAILIGFILGAAFAKSSVGNALL